jgi:hypothetical protein
MGNKELKKELYRFFITKYHDEINSRSSNSILASFNDTTKAQSFDMRKIGISRAHWRAYIAYFWTKRHKDTRATKKIGRSCGGIDRVAFDPRLRELNRIYVTLPAEWRNLLRAHILEETTYSELAENYKEYRLTSHQIREIFRRKIYPLFYKIMQKGLDHVSRLR